MRLRPQRVLTLHARRANSSRNSVLKTAVHRQTNRRKTSAGFLSACLPARCAVFFLGLVLCCNKYKRAMTARFRNVAEGNISCLRDAQTFHRRGSLPGLRCLFWGLFLCRNKDKRAMTARFRNVAEGNISRLRDAQAFHTAVKRPPYFTFARQRIHFTVSAACRACPSARCAVLIYVRASGQINTRF